MNHTLGPWTTDDSRTIKTQSGEFFLSYLKDKDNNSKWKAAYAELDANTRRIVHCVNMHDELLEALKNALNILAGVATGDLKTIKADSPAIALCRKAIAHAEGKG